MSDSTAVSASEDIPPVPDSGPGDMPVTESMAASEPISAPPARRRRIGEIAWLRCLLLAVCSLLAVTLVMKLVWPNPTAYGQAGGQGGPATLPWIFKNAGPGNQLTVRLDVNWLTPHRWLVIPDDDLRSITIDGTPVPLDTVRPGGLQDYTRGFEIDLGPQLQLGSNNIVFVVDNGGGDGGLVFRPLLGTWRWLLIGLAFMPLLLGLGGLFRLRTSQYLVLTLALALLCAYWSATPWQMRAHDVGNANGDGGHIDYVIWVAQNLALPKPMDGWTYYHPPLYYVIGATAWHWAQWLSLPPAEFLQTMSLSLWLIFLTASAGTLRLMRRNGGAVLFIATAALAFWPSGIIHSIRIGNDDALFAISGLTTWFAVRWWQRRRPHYVWAMSLCCAIALLCKSNAIVLVAGCGLLLASELLRRGRRKRAALNVVIFGFVTACGMAASFAVRLYYYLHGQIQDWLVSNVGNLSGGLALPNTLKCFIPLDIPTFLTTPWMNAWDDAAGRANFWNYTLRTSLTGEFPFPDSLTQRVIAFAWGGCLLVLFGLALARLLKRIPFKNFYRFLPWTLFGLLWLASLMALRYKLPFSSSNDFRFIVPILAPAILFWAQSGRLARWLLLAITLSSPVFFLAL